MPNMLTAAVEYRALKSEFTDATLYVGLSVVPLHRWSTLDDVVEPDDASYERKPITFSAPEERNGMATIYNTGSTVFDPWEDDEDQEIVYAFVTTAANGTDGEIRLVIDLVPSSKPVKGEPVQIPADFIQVGVRY